MWWRSAWQVSQDVSRRRRNASLVGMAQAATPRPTVRSTVTCEAKLASRLTASGFSSSSITALWCGALLLCAGASLVHLRRAPEVLALSGMLAHAAVDGTWQSGTVRTLLLGARWRFGA